MKMKTSKTDSVLFAFGAVLAIQAVTQTTLRMPDPGALLCIGVLYASYLGGVWGGLICSAISSLYVAYSYSAPGLAQLSDENLRRTLLMSVCLASSALLMEIVKGRLARLAHDRAVLGAHDRVNRQSEDRFRSMVDDLPAPVWVSSLERGRTFFNESWLTLTGRSIEKEVGRGWADYVHPEDLCRCLYNPTPSADAPQQYELEYRLKSAEGDYLWIHETRIPRFSPEGQLLGYIGSCVDITDQKKGSEQRLTSAAILRRFGLTDSEPAPSYRQVRLSRPMPARVPMALACAA